jgi:hypothetical protein
MNKPNVIKYLMVAGGVLLLLALIGTAVTVSKPTRVNQKTALISYAQNGQFNYTTYLKPSHLYGPAPQTAAAVSEFPQKVVGNIAFTYTFQPAAADTSGTARIEAVLENPGIWQKTLLLVPDTAISGNFTLNFSMDIPQLTQIFTAIETETDISSTSENVVINAYFQSGSSVTVQSLPITIENNLIAIPNSLSLTQDAGFGQFSYNINPVVPAIQTTNTSYPSFNLAGQQPIPTTNTPIILEPGQIDFINLIDKMNVNFAYHFQADKPVENLNLSVDIVANLVAAQSWSKSFDLLQTAETGNFNLDLPIDIAGYASTIQSINSETGASPASYNLTITVNIHATGETSYGPIDETFSPALTGTITGNVLNWAPTLTDSKNGAINRVTTTANKVLGLSVRTASVIFIIFSFIFMILLAAIILYYLKNRGHNFSSFDVEIQKIQKSYGARIAESKDNPVVNNINPVPMNSIGDLIKIADELGKPVIHQSEGPSGDIQLYYVIDGNTCYQYSLSREKSKQNTDAAKDRP